MQRRYDLDWVRIAAFFLLVLYHTGMYYVTWDWHVKSPYASDTIEPLMLLTSPWRLSLLFLISGAATAFLFAKQPAGFVRQRSWRLLLPLIFGMLVIVVPQAYYELLESRYPGGYHNGYLAFWGRYLQADPSFCDDDGCLDLPTWNHLWFVAYLWVYTMIGWALLRFAPNVMARVGGWLACRLSGIGVLLWPALLLAVVRLALVGRFESTHALVDDWYNHAQYLPLFMLGMLVGTRDGFWSALQRLRWPALACAVAGYAFIVWYFYASGYSDEGTLPPEMLRMTQRLVWALFQWAAIAAIFGFVRGIAFTDSPALHYLREAVFPIYILHQTIIVVLAHNAQPLGLRPAIEGPLLVLATFGLCFSGFEIVRRVRWLRPLFGLKADPRALARPVEQSSAATTSGNL
ncbi:MAG: acyltransferase family protein [Lysobacteraceae bacterium]